MITLTNVKQDKNIGICSYGELSNEMPIVLALGMFDGVHVGHQKLLSKTVELAKQRGASPTMMTFSEHPNLFIQGKAVPELLTTVREKAMLACDQGIKQMLLVSFDEDFCELSPEHFIDDYILSLNVSAVVCGYNYRFGKNASGTAEFLARYLQEKGIDVFVEDKFSVDGVAVNSTLIRDIIRHGDILYANRLLGYDYSFGANVLHGFKRGTGLGFPTANIIPQHDKCLPPNGVYATITTIDGKRFGSVTNVGDNPTYNNKQKTVETYIFGFDGDLYDKYVYVSFIDKIRDEIKFDDPLQLSKQIERDVDTAKGIVLKRM